MSTREDTMIPNKGVSKRGVKISITWDDTTGVDTLLDVVCPTHHKWALKRKPTSECRDCAALWRVVELAYRTRM